MRNEECKSHLVEFYSLLEELKDNIGGARTLTEPSSWKEGLPDLGVYFFQEPGEQRSDSGIGPRIVRVGTVKRGSLVDRLAQHRNKSVSVFRKYVEASLKKGEKEEEANTSDVIREMPFLWIVEENLCRRLWIECNAIALLSNYSRKIPLDAPSQSWLGNECNREEVRRSGLWNIECTDAKYCPEFLTYLRRSIDKTHA